MSERENPPSDVFDAVCRLDDLVEWLAEAYPTEAELIARASTALKGYIVLVATPDPEGDDRGD